eukprot:scaffold5771_cov184-Skeletonema_marinoi.AAC.2
MKKPYNDVQPLHNAFLQYSSCGAVVELCTFSEISNVHDSVSTYVVAAKKSRAKKATRSEETKAQHCVITINMISSATSSSDDDNNNNVSLSVVQTVKKWIRNSWPFATAGKIDERRPDDNAARQDQVLYIHEDECASVDDSTVIDGDRRYDEKCRDDNEESGDVAAVEDYGSKEALSASLSNEQHGNDNDDYKAGSRVMDIVMASPKKYFLRSSRRRRSCRFQLDDDKIDVVARSSHDEESVMASGHFGGLNDIDGADSKVSSMTNSLDDRSKQGNDNNDNEVDELAAPALPQDTTTTTITNHHSCWTQQEITSLRKAYQQSNPTSPTLWQDISTAMNSNKRSASECQRKWFSLVATPKKRVGRRKNGRVVNDVKKNKYGEEEDGSEEEDDLFDSTPLKCAVQEIENDLLLFQHHRRTTAASAKQEELLEQDNNDTTFHSPNKIMTKMMIKSPLSKRPRMFSPKNKNSNNGGMKNDGILSPLINRRKGYNTYVNNLRREIGRAQKARRGDDDEKMSGDENIGRCGNNSGRGGRGKGGGSIANKSSTIRIKEGNGKSQLSAELVVDGSSFVLNIPQEESDDENGSDVDLFEEVFRMEDEENEFPCD